jgi:hypothetical protein
MGKAAKAHRAKVEKKNRRIAQERYAMQNALNKMMKQMAEQKDAESLEQQLNVTVGGNETPFSVIDDTELNSIVEFKENNQGMFQVEEPEFDSAGFSIADREESQVEDQISELEK